MRALAPAAALLAALAGCSTDFTPRSVLEDVRVLALEASPLDLQPVTALPGQVPVVEPIALQAVDWLPASATVAPGDRRWSFCPFSTGATAGYACIDPRCEQPLTPVAGSGGRRVEVPDPGALLAACLAAVGGGGGGGVPGVLPDAIELLFRYQVTAADPAGGRLTRDALQRVTLHLRGAPLPRNLPPAFEPLRAVTIQGPAGPLDFPATPYGVPVDTGLVLRSGGVLELSAALAPGSAQPYRDALGQPQVESPIVSWYTTNGRFDFDRASGPEYRVQLKYDAVVPGRTAELYAVARDLRGGETVVGPYLVRVQ